MARTVEKLLRRTEARAQEKLRGNLRALRSESLAVLDSSLLRRHPHITLAAAAAAGAAAVPFVLRLLRSPGRAMRLAGMARPFLKDVLR
ncbi:MAG: hypothetical protein ACKVXR_18560 [Planctomycetota bacterium]